MKLKDKKIRIIAFTSTTNEHGFNTEEWRPIHSGRLWAYYRQLSGSEFYASAMVNAAEEVVFTVNHRTDVTTEMLVEYGGKFYDIKRIDNYEGYTDDISLYGIMELYAPNKSAIYAVLGRYHVLKIVEV